MAKIGDTVMILCGNHAGHLATINSKTDKTATLIIHGMDIGPEGHGPTGNVPLRQFVGQGATVTSISGKYEGHVGIIHSFTAKTLKLLIGGSNVPSGSLPWSSIKVVEAGAESPRLWSSIKVVEAEAEAKKAQDTAPEDTTPKAANGWKIGDYVIVSSGKYIGQVGKINSKTDGTATLTDPHGNPTGNLKLDILRKISEGDKVKVTGGTHKGKSAIIHSMAAKTVRLTIEGQDEPTGNVPWGSIVIEGVE